jgi:hypothetical protein
MTYLGAIGAPKQVNNSISLNMTVSETTNEIWDPREMLLWQYRVCAARSQTLFVLCCNQTNNGVSI